MNLSQLVDQSACISTASFKKEQIRNEVNPVVPADACLDSLQRIITGLMEHAANNALDKNIRVVAKRFSDIILVQFRYNGALPLPSDIPGYHEMKNTAERLGGCLYMTHCGENHTTLSFTFHNGYKTAVA